MFKNNRILIVDDQEDLREQLGKLLVDFGQPNKTSTLVQSMRDRLMGIDPAKENAAPKVMPKYDIDTAGQGEEAFEMVQAAIDNKAPYAVVFTDMRMPPGWDGLKTAKKIREIDKNIEIVIMTAYADHSQDTIAEEVGAPEKLLYIKKPFQAEEIYQLAMSLTAKWSVENLERMRRVWLEKTLVCMRSARHYGDEPNGAYIAALGSFLSFLNSSKGVIAEWNAAKETWEIKDSRNVEKSTAEKFFTEHSEALQKNSAIQSNVEGVYVIPLKSSKCSIIIGVYDAKTQTDPEWYKLVNMLLITSVEGLENASIRSSESVLPASKALISEIRSGMDKLKQEYGDEKVVAPFLKKVDEILDSATDKA